MTWLVRLAYVGLLLAASLPAEAQSLGEVARQEELRRRSAPKAVKTLSNADLGASEVSAPAGDAAAESCYMSKSLDRCVRPEDLVSLSLAGAVTKDNAPFEDRWRRDAQALRALVDSARRQSADLEMVIADEGRSPGEKRIAEKALATSRQTLAGLEQQWHKLERAAANERIPRAWLEPVPDFSMPASQ